jgi:hypothetical protein
MSREKLLLSVLLVAGTWALAFLGPLSVGIMPIFLFTLYLAIRLRNLIPVAMWVASPVGIAFFMGVSAWSSERPAYVGAGLPSPSAANLDRDSRIWWNIGGCVISGNEWVYFTPHNFGLRLTATLLGSPPATYHGVYPTENEVKTLMEKTAMTPNSDFFRGVVVAEGKRIEIGKNCADLIRRDLGLELFDADEDLVKGKVAALLVNSECLVVRIKCEGDFFNGEPGQTHRDAAMLMDVKTMLPFARYSFAGSLPRIPRFEFQDHGGYGPQIHENQR